MVDWNLAVATATRLVRPGPEVSRDEARAVVAELRRHAKASEEHVRGFTRMARPSVTSRTTPRSSSSTGPAGSGRTSPGFREMLKPLLDKMQERRAAAPGGAVLGAVGGKVTGVELGMLLSFLSSRVLGQYETFAPATRDLPGRRRTAAAGCCSSRRTSCTSSANSTSSPHDFRLWVCLHEETHRTQFTAVPWLRDHIEGEIQSFLGETEVDPSTVLERLREAAQSLAGGRPEGEEGDDGGRSLVELVQTPAQREILGRLTAVMSLLEGHADFVMDGVGPEVVPSVAEIREKFQQRRASGAGRLDQALRKLLGLDAKLRQYRDGERFVRAVVDEVGMDGFNRVWTSPNTLPTKAEIAKPADWVARVHRKAES